MRHAAAAKAVGEGLTTSRAVSLPRPVLTGRGSEELSRDFHPSLDLAIELGCELAADFHHRQAHFGAVDQATSPQPMLGRGWARLGEQQLRQLRNLMPAR